MASESLGGRRDTNLPGSGINGLQKKLGVSFPRRSGFGMTKLFSRLMSSRDMGQFGSSPPRVHFQVRVLAQLIDAHEDAAMSGGGAQFSAAIGAPLPD